MRKHRNFLIFYCLWLTAIFAIIAVFDVPEEKKLPITKNNAVCEANIIDAKNQETNKSQSTWCCASMQEQPTTQLQ